MVNWRWLVGKRRWIGGKTAWVGGKTAVEWRPNRRRLARKTALVGGKNGCWMAVHPDLGGEGISWHHHLQPRGLHS